VKGDALKPRLPYRVLEALIVLAGIVLVAAAAMARQNWWDDHFLPLFFFSRDQFVFEERGARLATGLSGALLILGVRPVMRRLLCRASAAEICAATARVLLAAGLALVVSEWMLGHKYQFAAAEAQPGEEPPRQPDARLGWVFTPSHEGLSAVGGRKIFYATDPHGYRVRDRNAKVDFNAPSLLFTGESVIAGYGLNWQETIPAQVGALMNAQSIDMAVFGYASDQAYLRLKTELPRFRRPVAIVSLFIPSLFARNLSDDRPHIGPGLRWSPASHDLWLSSLLHFLVPYHGKAEIEQGIKTTRAILRAEAALACRERARALVVDPQYGPETQMERMLRQRILEDSGVAFLRVELDPNWHLKGDLHPDPRAAHAVALALAARLEADLKRPDENCPDGHSISAWAGAPR